MFASLITPVTLISHSSVVLPMKENNAFVYKNISFVFIAMKGLKWLQVRKKERETKRCMTAIIDTVLGKDIQNLFLFS